MNKLFFFSIVICLYSPSCFAQEFEFNGIHWSDSPTIVSKKLAESVNFEKLTKNGVRFKSIGSAFVFPYSLVGVNKRLANIDNKLSKCNEESISYHIAEENPEKYRNDEMRKAMVIKHGTFHFSTYDDRLLFYTIILMSDKKHMIINALSKKYGNPSSSNSAKSQEQKSWLIWENDSQLIAVNKTYARPLIYINLSHLEEHAATCLTNTKKMQNDGQIKANSLF